ncbi:hypothetical protein SUGI_1028520 [Cryptomeria japonica]|nr:hypothetical protein SUGI_1028520 [Cryptomeria japonica]
MACHRKSPSAGRSAPPFSGKALKKMWGVNVYETRLSVPALVVSSAQMAKDILTTHDLVFGNRPVTAAARYVAYGEIDPGLAPYGPYWRHMRKISVMQLLSVKRVDAFACLREEEAAVGVRPFGTGVCMAKSLSTSQPPFPPSSPLSCGEFWRAPTPAPILIYLGAAMSLG